MKRKPKPFSLMQCTLNLVTPCRVYFIYFILRYSYLAGEISKTFQNWLALESRSVQEWATADLSLWRHQGGIIFFRIFQWIEEKKQCSLFPILLYSLNRTERVFIPLSLISLIILLPSSQKRQRKAAMTICN